VCLDEAEGEIDGEATAGVPARVPPAVHRHVAEQPLDVAGVPVQRLPAVSGPAGTDACWCGGLRPWGPITFGTLSRHCKLYLRHILPDALNRLYVSHSDVIP